MKIVLRLVFVLFFLSNNAQEKIRQNVYFDVDIDQLNLEQQDILCDFYQKIDPTHIVSVSVFGFCDDRGSTAYNIDLSIRRVATIEKMLIEMGLPSTKLVQQEGKGRILINKDTIPNLDATRSYNRRVEICIEKKVIPNYFMGIPKLYAEIQLPPKKGDRIYLEQVQFGMGSSYLNTKSRETLDRIVLILEEHPYVEFEIQGHVCCTPNYYSDAIDNATKQRRLSFNRAKAVYHYLLAKKIKPSRMTYKGYGNRNSLGKAPQLDRRVELVITKC